MNNSKIKLHNHFKVEFVDEFNNKRTANAYNLVTDYGITNIMNGKAYPSTISLGNGAGTPEASRQSLFSSLGSYSATKSVSYDPATYTHTTTLTVVLTESDLADTDITEIGIGSSSSLYTHALFTDAMGQPITIHKGTLERMTVTAIAYITFDVTESTDVTAMTCNRILTSVTQSQGHIGLGSKAYYGFCQIGKNGVMLPVVINPLNIVAGSYNSPTKVVSFTNSLASAAGSGLLNCYTAGIIEHKAKNSHSTTQTWDVDRGIWPLFIKLFDDVQTPIETIGTGDGETKEFAIPTKLYEKHKVHIYLNDAELSAEQFEIVNTGSTSYSLNGAYTVACVDTSYKKYVIAVRRARICNNYGNSAEVPMDDILCYMVTLDDDFNIDKVETKLVSVGAPGEIHTGTQPSSGNTNSACIIPNPPYCILATDSLSGGGIYHVDSNFNRTFICNNTKYLIDKDNENIIYTADAKYEFNPETRQVTKTSGQFIYTSNMYRNNNHYKWNKDKIIQWSTVQSDKVARLYSFSIAQGAVSYVDYTLNKSMIGYSSSYYKQCLVDLENKLIITAWSSSSNSSSSASSTVRVHFMNDDMTEIISTADAPLAWSPICITKYDTDKYRVQMGGANNYHDSLYTVDLEAKTVTRTADNQYGGKYLRDYNVVEVGEIEGITYTHEKALVPTDYKVVLKTPPAQGDSVKMTYSMRTINKSTDWQLNSSYKYGYEGSL